MFKIPISMMLSSSTRVTNGHHEKRPLSDVETEKREWKKVMLKDQPSPRGNHGGVVVGNDFMVIR